MALRTAGKLIANAGKGYHILSRSTITTYTKPLPCPPSLKEYGFTLKTCASLQADFFDSIYKTPPPPVHEVVLGQIVENITHFTPFLVPFASINAVTHSVLLAYLLYLQPKYFFDQTKKLMTDLEVRYKSYRGVTGRFLAGISNENFKRVCAIADFVCSPAKSIASYKDYVIQEVKILRKAGEGDKLVAKTGDWSLYSNEEIMYASLEPWHPEGSQFQIFVCYEYLLLIEDDRLPGKAAFHIVGLPKFPFHPKDVSATFANEKLLVKFVKACDGDEIDTTGRSFSISVRVVN